MQYQAKVIDPVKQKCHCLLVVAHQDSPLNGSAQQVDAAGQGALAQLAKREGFAGKAGDTLLWLNPTGIAAERLLLMGLGKADKDGSVPPDQYRKALRRALTSLKGVPGKQLALALGEIRVKDRDTAWCARQLAELVSDVSYRFDRLKSQPPEARRFLAEKLLFGCNEAAQTKGAATGLGTGAAIAKGTALARDLGNLPGNICTPAYLADEARRLARNQQNLTVKVLEEKHMKELGMGALLSVSAGSEQPAKLIVMEYRGSRKKNEAPLALVGKGITFDTGGISIKPPPAMDEMKFDMCGAASVLGVFATLLELQPALNLVGVIAASENMPDGRASKPGDVVTSMSGQTIEILNTDAEGRLVLCDALTYTERFKPRAVVDIATLTGACVIALGNHATGLYSNRDELARALLEAGETAGDRAWQMPLWDEYQKQLDSNFADMANVGGREAGSVTAACFLSRFAKKFAWAHLDIAGTAWRSGGAKGATGRPVPLLVQYLLNQAGS